MRPRFNIWLEVDGEVASSCWRVRLLEAIGEQGSITAGAKAMDVPYRVAWQKVHEMEERLGVQLLDTQTGGQEGGGAVLTDAGRTHVDLMRSFCEQADKAIHEIYRDTFPPTASA